MVMTSRPTHDTDPAAILAPYRLPRRVYAEPGTLLFGLALGSRNLLHGGMAPEIVSGTQPWVGRSLCGLLIRLSPSPYEDVWPRSDLSCTSCWRIALRRGLVEVAS